MQPILVTGAAGQLGRSVVQVAMEAGISVVGCGRAELDVTDASSIAAVLGEHRPRAVIHCAAWTDVDGAESDHEGAFHVNERGARLVAEACERSGVHLVAVSTDYVFPGDAAAGYAEDDEVGPINAYGESKLAGEVAIRSALGESACIARTAWLFSEHPPNFVQTIARLARERDELAVVDDQRGNPTWCGHLARALVECADGLLGGTHHLVDSPAATWLQLAQAVVDELGAACRITPTTSEAYPRPARRAACSVLRVTRSDTPAMGDWRAGVRQSLLS